MVNRHSRDFITGYKLDNNNIIVTLGTGEKIIYPIEERNRIKLAIEKGLYKCACSHTVTVLFCCCFIVEHL